MKIAKYIALLLLLTALTFCIFIATLSADYTVVRSKIIKTPKATIYNFVNDFKNWEEFGSWKQDDPEIKISYPAITSGIGASYSWKGPNGSGNLKTIAVKENDSIHQRMELNGEKSEFFWTFKDTLGKTKVTWLTKGKMSFGTKIYTSFIGGIDRLIGNSFERSLVNLDRTLDFEINTFSIKVEGIVQKSVGFFIQKTINSKITDVPRNSRIISNNLFNFLSKNKIGTNGKPFIIYNSTDEKNNLTNFSIGIPIRNEIITSPESEIVGSNLAPFQAIKTTLKGDYSHTKEALAKTRAYILKSNWNEDSSNPIIAVYSISKREINNPSKWITEFFIPVKPKYYTPKPLEEIISTEAITPNP